MQGAGTNVNGRNCPLTGLRYIIHLSWDLSDLVPSIYATLLKLGGTSPFCKWGAVSVAMC